MEQTLHPIAYALLGTAVIFSLLMGFVLWFCWSSTPKETAAFQEWKAEQHLRRRAKT